MRKIIYLFFGFSFFVFASLYGKTPKQNLLQLVDVPDSIYLKLESAYKSITGFDSVNAGRNVRNLINRKDFVFKNNLYSFKGQGPHFPRCIFIFKYPNIYIFKSIGAFDFVGVLQEYLECIKLLELSKTERVLYLKSIVSYLENESGLTYGTETKTLKKPQLPVQLDMPVIK